MNRKYINISIFFVILMFDSCIPKSYKISINDVWKHVNYQDEHVDLTDLFDEYDNILKKYPCPNSYFLLSRCIKNDQVVIDTLESGLKLYPNDILLNSYLAYKLLSDSSVGQDHPKIVRGKEICSRIFKNDKHMVFAAYAYYNYYRFLYSKIDPNNISDLYSNLRDQERYITIAIQEAKKDHLTRILSSFFESSYLVKKKITNISNQIHACSGKEADLRSREYARITAMSNMILFELRVTNQGNCIYKVYAKSFDELYGKYYDFDIVYRYSNGVFTKIN